jgi:P-type conjugative transfer protein TrbJ
MRSRRLLASAGMALTLAITAAPPAAQAQFTVIDPVAIGHLIAQYNNQIQSLTNELTQIARLESQLTNQAQMLQHLGTDITGPIAQITGQATSILQQAKGIGYGAQDVVQQYQNLYPKSLTDGSAKGTQDALASWRLNNETALQDALRMQNQIAQDQPNMASQVSQAVQASQGAAGQTAAIQATNQLLATVSSQLTQLQNLLITQARAEQTVAAQAQATQAAAEADRKRFWNVSQPPSRLSNPGQL